MKRERLVVSLAMFLLTLLIAGVVACGGETTTSTTAAPTTTVSLPDKTLDIGVASALTGDAADLGTQLHNGALLAIEDQNAKGGITIAGEDYALNPIVMDTQSAVAQGKLVGEQLIYDKKVKIIVGPCIGDAYGIQPVVEANKVLTVMMQPIVDSMEGPDKPYTFFSAGPLKQFYNNAVAYVAEFYPEAKTMVSVMPDMPDTPSFAGPAEEMCGRYGIEWLGVETYPTTTKDFSPLISTILAGDPDIVDTGSSGGAMGALCVVLAKQLREAGYTGLIMMPVAPSPKAIQDVLPEQYKTNLVVVDINPKSPDVPASYGELQERLLARFPDAPPFSATMKMYNAVSGLLQFLDGQTTMDTTAWATGFAEYRWQNSWGEETFFCGEPIWGINHSAFDSRWVSEYKNGVYETKWQAELPMELYVKTE